MLQRVDELTLNNRCGYKMMNAEDKSKIGAVIVSALVACLILAFLVRKTCHFFFKRAPPNQAEVCASYPEVRWIIVDRCPCCQISDDEEEDEESDLECCCCPCCLEDEEDEDVEQLINE